MRISVIIPVYNVEKYIRRCVDSVLKQTYKDIEVVLVDDGSPDGCPQICDEYAQHDSRVTVLHKKNGGLSSARNAALDSPLTGDYVTFIDSDDWIEPETYEYCIRLLQEHAAECIQYEVNMTYTPERQVVQPKEQINVFEGKDVLQYFMHRSTIASGGYSVCGGIYQRNILEGIRFREGKINEDIDYKFKVMKKCKKMVVSNQKMYNYFQATDSISTSGLKMRDFQLREAADLLCEMASKESYGTIAFLGKVKKARTAFSLLSKIAYFGIADPTIEKRQTVKELISEHRRNVCTLLKAPIPLSRKVLAVMFAINFKITEKAIQLTKML